MNLFSFINGKDYLKALFDERSINTKKYSYSAFAKSLGISKSSLHRYLNGERLLSAKSLNKIIETLNLSEEEAKYFLLISNTTKFFPASKTITKNPRQVIELDQHDLEIFSMMLEFLLKIKNSNLENHLISKNEVSKEVLDLLKKCGYISRESKTEAHLSVDSSSSCFNLNTSVPFEIFFMDDLAMQKADSAISHLLQYLRSLDSDVIKPTRIVGLGNEISTFAKL